MYVCVCGCGMCVSVCVCVCVCVRESVCVDIVRPIKTFYTVQETGHGFLYYVDIT